MSYETAYTMQVIVIEHTMGEGKDASDPVRRVTDYRSLGGEFLARRDQWRETHDAKGAPNDAA